MNAYNIKGDQIIEGVHGCVWSIKGYCHAGRTNVPYAAVFKVDKMNNSHAELCKNNLYGLD